MTFLLLTFLSAFNSYINSFIPEKLNVASVCFWILDGYSFGNRDGDEFPLLTHMCVVTKTFEVYKIFCLSV